MQTITRSASTASLAAAGLALIATTYGLARFAYGLFTPAFRAAFDLDGATVGLIAAGSYAAYCLGVVAATIITPRRGPRIVAVAAGILATTGIAVIGSAQDPLALAVGVVVGGASTGVASPALADAVTLRAAPARRDRLQAIINAGTGLGVMVSGPVALFLLDEWRVAWALFALLAAGATAAAAVAVPRGRADVDRRITPARVSWRRWGELAAAAFLLGAGSGAVWTFGQDVLGEAVGRGPATVAWIVLGACGLLGAASGDLVLRIGVAGAWRILVAAMAASTAAVAVSPLAPPLALVAAGVFGASYIALTGVLLVAGTRTAPGDAARGVGIAFLALAIGQALATPIWGLLGDATELSTSLLWAAGFTAGGLIIGPPASPPAEAAEPQPGAGRNPADVRAGA